MAIRANDPSLPDGIYITRTLLLLLPKPQSLPIMESTVRYIPPQMDSFVGLTTQVNRGRPFRLFIQDAAVLVANLRYLPWLFFPFRTSDPSAELYLSFSGFKDIFLQVLLFVLEVIMMCVVFPIMLLLPNIITLVLAAVCFLAIAILSWPLHGPKLAFSRMNLRNATAQRHETERWLFINGCVTRYVNFGPFSESVLSKNSKVMLASKRT